MKLIPSGGRESGFSISIQGVTEAVSNQRGVVISIAAAVLIGGIEAYSAAATNFGLPLAADIMKSEMRGTISDLKREPLKTP
jgi:hypothetical protein